MNVNNICIRNLKVKGVVTEVELEPYLDGRQFTAEMLDFNEDGSFRVLLSLEADRIGLADSDEERTFQNFILNGRFNAPDSDGVAFGSITLSR